MQREMKSNAQRIKRIHAEAADGRRSWPDFAKHELLGSSADKAQQKSARCPREAGQARMNRLKGNKQSKVKKTAAFELSKAK